MNSKTIIWICMIIFSSVGGFLPTLWGASFLSFSSIFLTAAGGLLGIWIGFKLSRL